MGQEKVIAGFIGAGGIARSHIFSLNSVKYYYNDAPGIDLAAVCSSSEKSRRLFAERYGFAKACDLDEFVENNRIDTVFILGPNKVHFEHLKAVLGMKAIKRIYLEKPVCATLDEETEMRHLISLYPMVKIQVGFQYVFTPSGQGSAGPLETRHAGKTCSF